MPLRTRAAAAVLILGVIIGVATVSMAPPVHASTPGWLGVYTGASGSGPVSSFAASTDETVSYAGTYLPGGSWSAIQNPAWYIDQFSGGPYKVVYSIPMLPDSTTTLAEGAAGDFNSYFYQMGQSFVANGAADAILRLGWEFTGNWYPWSALNDPADFAAYWRQIVNTLRTVPGQAFTFDWNAGANQSFDPTAAYPGDSYVDYVTADIYDQSWDPAAGYTSNSPTLAGQEIAWNDTLTETYGLNWLASFAAAHNKPLGFPEWGLDIRPDGHGGGDDPYFIQQMYNFMATHRTAYELYFDMDASDGQHDLADSGFTRSQSAFISYFSTATGGATSTSTTAAATTSTTAAAPTTTVAPTPTTAAPTPTTVAAPPTTAAPTPTPKSKGKGIHSASVGASEGYWVLSSSGTVYSFGGAANYGSVGRPSTALTTMAPDPGGQGYWLAGADGSVYSFGEAGFHGSLSGIRLAAPVVSMAATADGGGYWMMGADGGIFSFGDARFYGSTGGVRLNARIVALAPTHDGHGYWLVGADGGIFCFGDARFYGSAADFRLAAPVVGMVPTSDGRGYWLVGADGGVFAFGDAGFVGSLGGTGTTNVVAVSPTGDGLGYRLVTSAGRVYAFGDAGYSGGPAGLGAARAVGIFTQP